MDYQRISADCHIDLPMLAPDIFTANASAALKERMPYVTDGPDGPYWTCKNGGSFGLLNGVGPAGQKLVPGQNYRVDVMAAPASTKTARRASATRPIRCSAPRTWTATGCRPRSSSASSARPPGSTIRCGQRDVPDLQRLAGGFLQARPRRASSAWPACPTGTSPPRCRRSTAWPSSDCAAWSCRARGTWSPCGIPSGSRSGRPSTRSTCRCTSTRSRRCRPASSTRPPD